MTTITIDQWLASVPPGDLCGWLPSNVHRQGGQLATPQRKAWAIREIAAISYAGRCRAEQLSGAQVAAGSDAAASVAQVLQHR